jgi:hypothetical protein
MKINILILPSLLLLVFFATAVYAINWDNPSSQSVDQMLSGSETGDNNTHPGGYPTPAAARSAESKQKGKDILNVPMSGKLDTIGYNPKDTRSQDLSQTSPAQNVTANITAVAPAQVAAPAEPALVSGNWYLNLTDSASRTAVLTLFQNGDAVFGSGVVNLDANTTMMAAASGSLLDGELNLDLVTLGKVNLYRLDLTVSGESATGNYTAYSTSGATSTGEAEGTRSVPPS